MEKNTEVYLHFFQAIATRDAMAKALYGTLFDWIVLQVNHALAIKQLNVVEVGLQRFFIHLKYPCVFHITTFQPIAKLYLFACKQITRYPLFALTKG